MNPELKEKMQKFAEVNAITALYRPANDPEYVSKISFLAGAEAMYAELATLVEWVSVEDRLPEEYKLVLVKSKYMIKTGFYNKKYNVFSESDDYTIIKEIPFATHWRRIEL